MSRRNEKNGKNENSNFHKKVKGQTNTSNTFKHDEKS